MTHIADTSGPWIERPDRYKHHNFDREIKLRIRELRTDNWHGPLYIIKDYFVIAAFVWLVFSVSWWFYPLAVLMIGAHQRAISTILHDSAHGVLVRNRTFSFLLGTLPTAWPIFQRHFAYKKSHVLEHHPFLGRIEDDPDLTFFIREGVFTPQSDSSYLWRVVILPMLGGKTAAYLKYLVENRWSMIRDALTRRNDTEVRDVEEGWQNKLDRYGFALFWLVVLTASISQGFLLSFVLLWVVPYLTTFHIIGWFIEMSEHCSSIRGQTVNLHMTRNRRSRHIEKWLTGINNDHHHLDHHLDPTTPFWRLPEAHAVRMQDPIYAAHCLETGGIFQAGPNGEPSIISVMREQNRQRYAMSRRLPSTSQLSSGSGHAEQMT